MLKVVMTVGKEVQRGTCINTMYLIAISVGGTFAASS